MGRFDYERFATRPGDLEKFAMALEHPKVFLGSAGDLPHHGSPELVRFISGAGRGKVLFGTGFPVVSHRHALTRLAELDLGAEVQHTLLEGAARNLFTRLARNPEENP